MKLTGLHLLLTYRCLYCCDHCFVWGGPEQKGSLNLRAIDEILAQAKRLPEMEWIYFEGGEPFLNYPVLVKAAKAAHKNGFKVGIVTNAFWAEDTEDSLLWLEPFAGTVSNLTVSSDLYHSDRHPNSEAKNALAAAERLGIPSGLSSIAQAQCPPEARQDQWELMFRGRAAVNLVGKVGRKSASGFTTCPHEELREPNRVHVDCMGNLHLCQGIVIGNLFKEPLEKICHRYEPENHPVVGPLLRGGPLELGRSAGQDLSRGYADACHLCYLARCALRSSFPSELGPDQMYGEKAE